MKPAPFRYLAPGSVEEAVELLAEYGDEARVLAGGQSLVPAMNMRLARPAVLVDINRIPGLDRLLLVPTATEAHPAQGKRMCVTPLVRHAALESSPVEGPAGDLISQTAHLIAHPPIRARGTMLGSLAFADPAAEWCAVTQLFEAEVTARSARGDRRLHVRELLAGAFKSCLEPDELLVEACLVVPDEVVGTAIVEQSHTEGDFAVVLAAAMLVREQGRVRHRVVAGGVAPEARRFTGLESELDRDATIRNDVGAIGELIREEIDPPSDPYGSSEYRAHLGAVLIGRALQRATA